MSERTLEYNLSSCWEETAPPFDVVVKNTDGTPLLKVTFREPTWRQVQETVVQTGHMDDPAQQEATWLCLCIQSWDAPEDVSTAAILKLHPAVQKGLRDVAMDVIKLKESQLKNSMPLSQSSGSQQSNGRAETLTGMEQPDGVLQS